MAKRSIMKWYCLHIGESEEITCLEFAFCVIGKLLLLLTLGDSFFPRSSSFLRYFFALWKSSILQRIQSNSLTFMIVGRALTGLGGARVVNKRLIADTTPIEYRTMESASFATANACGAASGPFFAILLSYSEFEFSIFGTKIYVNSMTA